MSFQHRGKPQERLILKCHSHSVLSFPINFAEAKIDRGTWADSMALDAIKRYVDH